jgi:prepilin-type N-terminal cleavage/methylation domain-containing protein
MNVTKKTNKGFTIIEVVLVLAIAGLIFLMVFVALPALQSGQRDTARKSDVGSVAAAVTTYSNNNRGTFPTSAQLQTQLGQTGSGTSTTYDKLSNNITSVTVGTGAAGNVTAADGAIIVYKGFKCSANGATGVVTLAAGTARQFATVTRIEGGSNSGYCLDS